HGPAVVDGQRCPARCDRPVDRARPARHPRRDGTRLRHSRRRGRARRRGGRDRRGLRAHGPDRPAPRRRAGASMTGSLGATGAIAGLLFGLGTALVAWRVSARRPRLIDRIEPYLREPPRASALLAARAAPFPRLERIVT